MYRLVTLAILVAPTSALAWECVNDQCPTVCAPPLRYQIGAVPRGLDEAMVVSEVQRAFALWEAVDCASVSFEYTGRAGDGGSGVLIAWTEDWPIGASQWAAPAVSWEELCIQDSSFTSFQGNARDFEWGFSPAAGSMVLDVYTVILTAVGGFIGLGDSRDAEAVMYFDVSGETRTAGLAADDIDGACTLYGDRMRPDAGVADAGVADGLACSPCDMDDDCDSNVCLRVPGGSQVCGAVCETDSDCEEGASCEMASGDVDVCVRSDGPDIVCAMNATTDAGVDGDAGADAGTTTDGAVDSGSGGSGGGGCDVGASTSGAWLLSLLFLRRRRRSSAR